MKNQLHDLESMMHLNQSYNGNPIHLSERTKSWIENLKNLSLIAIICLIIFPIIFIIIGIIYRNACVAKQNLPLFLIIFGMLILINLLIYTIVGATFLACKIFSDCLWKFLRGYGFSNSSYSIIFIRKRDWTISCNIPGSYFWYDYLHLVDYRNSQLFAVFLDSINNKKNILLDLVDKIDIKS
jgi:hypothetical protein